MINSPGIYKITNKVNGKFYIGQSSNIASRFQVHKSLLSRGKSHNPHLQSSWNKYGKDSFLFEVLCLVDTNNLDLYEQILVDGLHPHYNIRKECKSNRGMNHTEGTKEKIRNSQIGKFVSEETKKLISAKGKGRKLSAEAKDKLVKFEPGHTINLGRVQSEEEKTRRAKSLRQFWSDKVKLVTQSTKDKLSQSLKAYYSAGRPNPNAKLTKEQVIEIRDEYNQTQCTFASLGRKYNMSPTTISYICSGKLWGHIK